MNLNQNELIGTFQLDNETKDIFLKMQESSHCTKKGYGNIWNPKKDLSELYTYAKEWQIDNVFLDINKARSLMSRKLGKPLELTAIKHGNIVSYGGFIFKVPIKYTHIRFEAGTVIAFNKNSQMILGVFEYDGNQNNLNVSKIEVME